MILFCAMTNPFEFGRELGVAEIVDREAEITEVVETVTHGGKLFIIGPRRYGKTSILKQRRTGCEALGRWCFATMPKAIPPSICWLIA